MNQKIKSYMQVVLFKSESLVGDGTAPAGYECWDSEVRKILLTVSPLKSEVMEN